MALDLSRLRRSLMGSRSKKLAPLAQKLVRSTCGKSNYCPASTVGGGLSRDRFE